MRWRFRMPKFLTFDNRHLAPVEEIDPKSLKHAAMQI